MNKRFFLAALSAVALTMGFTACSEDDEIKPSGDYKLTVNVHTDAMGSDLQEYATIYNAYRSAFGLSEMNENTESEYVDIQGKDSLDCVANIQKFCAKAEKQLDGMTWADKNVIAIRDTMTNAVIYTRTYGASADNGSGFALFTKYWYSAEEPDTSAVVSFMQFHVKSSGLNDRDYMWYNYYMGADMNCGAGGKYVFPYYNVSYPQYSYQIMNDLGGLLVLNNESGHDAPQQFEYDGITYYLTQNCDLNLQAGGNYLYLYWAKVRDIKTFLKAKNLRVWWSGKNCNDDEIRKNFVKGVTLYSNDEIKMTHPNGIDLNLNAGGDYVYLWADYTPWKTNTIYY